MTLRSVPYGTTSVLASQRADRFASADGYIAAPASHYRGLAPAVILVLLSACFAAPVLATPERAARFYEDAQKKFERKEFSATVIQLKNALQNASRMLSAHVLLGKALLQSEDLQGAEAAFEDALKRGLDRSHIALPLAQIHLRLGRPDLVIDGIPAAGLPRSVRVEVLSLRGTAYAELGKTRLAKDAFNEARAVDPQSPAPYVAEISSLLAEKNYDQAKHFPPKRFSSPPTANMLGTCTQQHCTPQVTCARLSMRMIERF